MKRFLIISVCLCLLCSLMAGCTQQNESSDSLSLENSSQDAGESFEPRNIDFTGHTFVGASFDEDIYYGVYEYSDELIIKSVDELNEFKTNYKIYGDDFVAYIDGIENSFFDKNALILSFITYGDYGHQCQIKDLFVDGTKLTLTIRNSRGGGANAAVRPNAYAAEVNKTDIMSVEEIEVLSELQYWTEDSFYSLETIKNFDFQASLYGGALVNFCETAKEDNTTFGMMSIITDQGEMKDFLRVYTYSGKGENLKDSADQYNEEFFKDNIIVAVPVKTTLKNIVYKVEYVKSFSRVYGADTQNGVCFDIYAFCDGERDIESSESIIFICLKKSQIPENSVYFAKLNGV